MSNSMRHSHHLAVCALTAVTFASGAYAVGTRRFELDSLDELSGGDLKGTSVDSLGRVRAGLDLGALPVGDATSIWSALALPDGSVLLGTANTGRIFRIANGQVAPYGETGQLVVTALVQAWNGGIFAATIPNGRIVRVLPGGTTQKFVDLDAKHVWALAFDAAQGALFAATGPDGKLFRIDASGRSQVYFDSDDPHLTALQLAPGGVLYAGSSGHALIYRITGPGRASVLFDLPGEEIRALALGPKGDLFAISNDYGELPDLQKRAGAGGQNPAGPVSSARPKPGKGTLTRFDLDGRPEKLFHRDDTHFMSLAVDDAGRANVGTGVEGRVYAVDDAHTSALVADTDERQVAVLSLVGRKRFIATSDPPVYREVRGVGGTDSVWTSRPLDAGLRARFGRITFESSGPLEMSVRTGNTKTPDSTWSAWGTPIVAPGDAHAAPARFIQVRARFSRDPKAVLSSVRIPFITDNLRPVLTSIEAAPRSSVPSARDGQLVPSSGGDLPSHSATVKLSWKVDNPDADPLRYRLFYRLERETEWRDLTRPDDPLTRAEYEWDTSSLPEGTYRVRVEVSDEFANPPDRVFRHSLDSGTIVVDNTPPVFRTLGAQGRRVQAAVVDGAGPIARVDVSVDGRPEWRPYLPKDGIFDSREEDLDMDLSPLVGAGNHLVAVRVFDEAGNYVVRSVELK